MVARRGWVRWQKSFVPTNRSASLGIGENMGIGVSIFLIAIGAILYFAVSATTAGVSISTVGVILMLIGGLGLVVSFVMLGMARGGLNGDRRTTVVRDELR
jgi:hypothetical protein